MKVTKSLLAVLLALVLLFSAVPMTALAAEADVAAVAVDPSTLTYSVKNVDQLKDCLEMSDETNVIIINVESDMSGWIGTAGDSSDNSYVRYGITVAKGKKVLNLNGHKVHFYNDYSVIYDHFGAGYAETKELNRLALINIPEGASLTVNGDAEGGAADSGMIRYHGRLLYKCDAVDQRDVFEIDGGDLTINSGYFVAGGETKSYTWTETLKQGGLFGTDSYYDLTGWYTVHGSAIRAITGNLTVNGGLFEGRGFDGYFYYGNERNGVLYAEEGMNSVVINNGHFLARSQANVFNARELMHSGRFVIKSGIFEVDQNNATLCTIYGTYSCASNDRGMQHIYIKNPDPYTNYYYIDTTDDPWYTEASYETLKEHPGYMYNFRWQYVYIAPKQGYQVHEDLSYTPTGEVELLYQGKEQEGVADSVYWNKKNSLVLAVDPDTLYFPRLGAWDKGVTQDLTATLDIHSYNGEGDRPLLAEGEDVTLTKNSDGQYTLDLNDLSSLIKSKVLKEGKTYEFRFTFDEEWSGRLDYDIMHTAYFYVTITEKIHDIYLYVTEPEYGVRSSKEIDLGDSGEFCTAEPVGSGWVYRESAEDQWSILSEGTAFTYNKEYAFNVLGSMKDGYSLASDAVIWINGEKAVATVLTDSMFAVSRQFDTYVSPIESIDIYDVPEPLAGGHPIYYATKSGSHYSIDTKMMMDWYDQDGFSMTKDDKFEAGKKYTVKFHVLTTNDYKFADGLTAYINDNRATVTEKWTDFTGVDHARVEYTFVCAEAEAPTVIKKIEVTITEPAAGEKPSFEASVPEGVPYRVDTEYKDYNDDVKNGVAWQSQKDYSFLGPDDVFEAGVTYAAYIELEPIGEEYDFTENRADDSSYDDIEILINGEEGFINSYFTYPFGGIEVSAYFTVGGELTPIDKVEVKIEEPAAGANPSYTAIVPDDAPYEVYVYTDEADDWYNGVGWYDKNTASNVKPDDVFVDGHFYYVSMLLVAKNGYCFDTESDPEIDIEGVEYNGCYYLNAYIIRVDGMYTVGGPKGYLVGDVNSSGEVNNRDAMILDRYVAGWTGYDAYIKIMDVADMNRDGEVTNRDAMILDRVVAGWDGYYDKYCILVGFNPDLLL